MALTAPALLLGACSGSGESGDAQPATVSIEVPEVLAVAVEASADADDIVIGAVLDLTGERAPADIAIGLAAQSEVARIVAAGGVADRSLVFLAADSNGSVADAGRAAGDLIDDGAVAVILGCDSDQAAAAAAVAEARGVLAIAPCAPADEIGAGRPGSLSYQLATPASVQGRILAEHVAGSGLTAAITVVETADPAGRSICDAFATRFTELGGLVRVGIEVSPGSLPADQLGESVGQFIAPPILVSCLREPTLSAALLDIRGDANAIPVLLSSAGDIDALVAAIPGDAAALGPAVGPLTPEQQALIGAGGIGGSSDLAGIAAVEVVVAAIGLAGGPSDGPALSAGLESGAPVTTVIGTFIFSPADHAGAAARPIVLRGHLADGASYVFERRLAG